MLYGGPALPYAISLLQTALEPLTKEASPALWAATQNNLAILEVARAQHPACETPRGHLEAALAHVEAALTVFDPVHMAYNHAKASRLRDGLLKALSD